MYADPTLMDLAAAYAKRRNGRKTKNAVACDRPGAKAKMAATDWTASDERQADQIISEMKALETKCGKKSIEIHDVVAATIPQAIRAATAAKDQKSYQLLDAAVRLATKADHVRYSFSRPGAKAEFASAREEAKASLTRLTHAQLIPHWVRATGKSSQDAPQYTIDGKNRMIEDILRRWHGSEPAPFARAASKAKFAQPPFSSSDLNALKRLVKQYEQQAKASKGKQGPNGENLEFKALSIAGWMQEMINYAQAGQTHRAYSIVRTSNPDYVRFLPASLVKAAWDVTKMSRPGAKAEMASGINASTPRRRLILQQLKAHLANAKADRNKEAERLASRYLQRILNPSSSSQDWMEAEDALSRIEDVLHGEFSRPGAKSTHAALPPQTLEAERKPGGGSHSEAVSRKIATLINEGKPQDQAVAIALDLERRGEL